MLNMAKKMDAGQTQTLKKVLRYMKPYRFFLLLSVILAAITVASTLYLPLLIGKAVDCIVGKGNVNFDAENMLRLSLSTFSVSTASFHSDGTSILTNASIAPSTASQFILTISSPFLP